MKDIPTAPPLPNAPPTQDFSKLGFVYIAVLGLANQVVPHTGSWRPLATALNYLVCVAPIVYMSFQAWSASPVGVQPDSSMGRDKAAQGTGMRSVPTGSAGQSGTHQQQLGGVKLVPGTNRPAIYPGYWSHSTIFGGPVYGRHQAS
ncbi:hypothetical protein DSO57_1027016 [Entomophthora muscae]|uniref:Uncharacterized protein n=1 Tax=Entomophthora muscae TaxID=34485 RepID=A0ACC2U0H7_9FUNG|nr:hypothetical protein DSO57_1027016 [Entomophthora muscae]